MKVAARIKLDGTTKGPNPWSEDWGTHLPSHHIICYDIDGTPHFVREFIWPWTAYTAHQTPCFLHFYYWKEHTKKLNTDMGEISAARKSRMHELQFLMTRQIYYGDQCSSRTLERKLFLLHRLARFAESSSRAVYDVLTDASLLDAFGASLPNSYLLEWITVFHFLCNLNPETQLGFKLASPRRWKDVARRAKEYRNSIRQFAPLPTRIYAGLINNLSAELDDIEAHKNQLLNALRDAAREHARAKASPIWSNRMGIGAKLIQKYGLADYLEKRNLPSDDLRALGSALREVFLICKLQIHVFSGMRDDEALNLPYHCMEQEIGLHGRKHCFIVGATTKLNNGRILRTKWVTTELDGFRAIRLAQEFAAVVYKIIGTTPKKADANKDFYPLFPSTSYLPWLPRLHFSGERVATLGVKLSHGDAVDSMLSRLCLHIEKDDIAELEEIDPFRAWHEEAEFSIGRRWPLTTHQLRRSLAVYANASGLVRVSSLRRQLQHITREMALYYGRGSTFCKNFLESDPDNYKKHIAIDWQNGAEEAEMLSFVRDVLNCSEPMFGPAGVFYDRQSERGEVMSRDDVKKQIKAGLLGYRESPLGGCANPDACETRKGLNLINTVCVTENCKYLIGKHSKIVQTIGLKRASMVHITPGSITEAMEQEELEALEHLEREWRPKNVIAVGR